MTVISTNHFSVNKDSRWDEFVTSHPDAHILQTADWGRHQESFGYSAEIAIVTRGSGENPEILAGALILFRKLPFGLGSRGYIPAGPLFHNENPADPINQALWRVITSAAKKHRALFLKIEPCNWYRPRPDLPAQLQAAGFSQSAHTMQPPRTVVIDISGTEDEILKRMNQSTRYKSKLREKKQIDVREGMQADVTSFNAIMAVTGERDQFGTHPPEYYANALRLFAKGERGVLLMASYEGRDLAGIMVFHCGQNAYYLYGASSNEERNRMPTYILQWEGIKWARKHGAIRYDMWGIPDEDETKLEAEFETRHDGLWGVYGFKRGFGGKVVRSIGAWDKVYNPLLYRVYRWYMNRRE